MSHAVDWLTTYYRNLTQDEMVAMAFDEGLASFERKRKLGLLSGPKGVLLHARFGIINDEGAYEELGFRNFGGDAAEQFRVNTDPVGGKLQSVLEFFEDSGDAAFRYPRVVPAGAPRWTGGVYCHVYVDTEERGTIEFDLGGAASGLQGAWDLAITKEIVNVYAALLRLHLQALYGKPEASKAADPVDVTNPTA